MTSTLLTIAPEDRKSLAARKALLNDADVAILCLPDEAAKESVSLIENTTTRVIDASTAHRVAEGWAYGFAEMDKDQGKKIAEARFVANPGCWPQGLIAALRPLIAAGLYAPEALHGAMMTGVSGYSGGGKQMIADYEQKGDAAPAVMPYALSFEHKHLPEMTRYSLLGHAPLFVPTVGDFYQGMLEIIPLPSGDGLPGAREVHAALSAHYAADRERVRFRAALRGGGENGGAGPRTLERHQQPASARFRKRRAGAGGCVRRL